MKNPSNQPSPISPQPGSTSSRSWFPQITQQTQLIIAFGIFTIIPLGLLLLFTFLQPEKGLSFSTPEQTFTIIFAVVIIIGVMMVVASITAGWLAKPIRELTELSRHIAAGALNLDIPVSSQYYEIREVTKSFNRLIAQLRDLNSNIERRMAERTGALEDVVKSLETSTKIGRQFTTILDIDELLQYIVDQLKTGFNFYHTQIYLIDNQTSDLVLMHASGEVGRELKARGHRLKPGQGIVGRVVSANNYFLSNNVERTPEFVRNSLLPDTRSELALPLHKGNQVLGVLDIQSDQLNRFTSTDVSLMQSITGYAVIALDNANLMKETQAALQEVERLNRRLTREVWQESTQELSTLGYHYVKGQSSPIYSDAEGWLPPMKLAAVQKQLVKQVYPGNGEAAKTEIALPLTLRGEIIGVLGVKREKTTDWVEEEVTVVEAVATQVALALENARLSKEQEKTIVQLKDIDRLKSEFLTSMSHELRTPLNSIIGFSDVLLQGIDGDLPDLALNDIQLIYNSGKHLLALINDILDLSKIEAGKMELVREAVDIEEVFNALLASSNSLIKDKPVEIIIDVSRNLPSVYADKLRLNQILLNLVSNAAKFTHEGSITIRALLDDEPDLMRISVTDTGIGIPPNKIGAIFERFRQADSSTTRKYGGTGLGLAICKQLVEMHGGEMGVESQEGVGSKFFFTIPVA